MKLQTKLRLITIFSICAALAAGFTLLLISREADKAANKDKIAEEIVRGVFELNTVTYEYLLHPEERMKVQWRARHNSLTILLKEAEFGKSEEQAVRDLILGNHEDLDALFLHLVSARERQANGSLEIRSELRERVMGQMLVKSQAIFSSANQLAEMSHAGIEAARKTVNLLLIVFVATTALVLGGISFLIGKSVVRPVMRLHEGTEIIGAGDLDHKVGTPAKDEIGQLSRAFDEMVEKRRHVEEDLLAASKEWRNTFDSTSDGISIHDSGGTILRANIAVGRLLGVHPKELIGKKCYHLFHGKENPIDGCPMVKSIQLKEPAYTEIFEPLLNCWLAVTCSPLFGDRGEARGVVHVVRDITERKQAEEKLRESEKKFRDLMENVPVGVSISTPEGGVPETNSTVWKIFGYDSKEEFMKVPASAHYHDPKDRERFVELHKKGDVKGFEARFKRKDGTVFWGSVNSLTQITETGILYLNAVMDITERKRAEDEIRRLNLGLEQRVRDRTVELETANRELAKSRNTIQNLLDNSPSLIYMLDVGGQFLLVNRRLEALLGVSHEALIGNTREVILPPEVAAQHRNNDIEVISTKRPISFEEENIEPDGKHYYASQKFPLMDSEGRVWAVCGISTDITESKRAEETLKNYTAQLEAANKELESFSYSVSHDLRAPLRAVDGFARMVIEDHAARLDGEGRRQLGVIRANAQKMGQLIDDLLGFSRMGRREMAIAKVDMTAMAAALAEELRGLEPGRTIEIAVAPLPAASGDPAMIRQAWMNLLSNAIKYTRPRAQARIEVGGQTDGVENIYCVKDNGVGFDMRYASKLFGVFQRLHGPEEFEGTGVGLALVQRIVHRHGGRVWAEGGLNQGATFYFSLPRASQGTGGET